MPLSRFAPCTRMFIALISIGVAMFLVDDLTIRAAAQPGASSPPEVKRISLIEQQGGRLAWSPDGSRIAYDRLGADGYYDVWLMNSDGTQKTPLTAGVKGLPGRHMGQPAWHPAGDWIVFQAEKAFHSGGSEWASPGIGKHNDLWVIRADGSVSHRLTNLAPQLATLHPHFSHDGKKLVWGEATNAIGGWVIKLADVAVTSWRVKLSNIRTLQPGPPPHPAFAFYETHGFSPDDREIIFTAVLDAGQHWTGMDIYRYDLLTGKLERLTDTPADWDEHAHFRPDGEWVVWASSRGFLFDPQTREGLQTEFWIMRPDGSGKKRLTGFNMPGAPEFEDMPIVCADAAWSPDGTKLAGLLILESEGLERIVVLDFGGDGTGGLIDPVIGDTPGETVIIEADQTVVHEGNVLVLGNGQLIVNGTLDLTGHLIVSGRGRVRFDGGQLHLRGNDTHVLVNSSAILEFVNQSLLHYEQTYVAQHVLVCRDNGQVSVRDSAVTCDGSTETIRLYQNGSYEALNVIAPDWKTWYVHDEATLSLENMSIGGDVVFYDRPTLRFVDTVGVMPWLYFDDGAVVDIAFPEPAAPDGPVSFNLDATTPGVAGIPWSLTVDNCRYVAWGLNAYPGSSVTVRDSALQMVMFRFVGEGAASIEGMMKNRSRFDDVTIPVADRLLRFVNTSVEWWKVDIHDQFRLRASDLVFSEMMLENQAQGHLTNSICEGQTIHVGAKNEARLLFEDGEIWSYVSVWDDALMVLKDSLVDYRLGDYSYQTRNIAHGRSRLYALNTTFGFELDPSESRPEAFDTALVMVARIDGSPSARVGDAVDIYGAAWIAAGPASPVTFNRYELYVAKEETNGWQVVAISTTPLKEGVLGVLDTTAMAPGIYRLALKVWVDGDSDSTAPTHFFAAETSIQLNR